MYNKNYKTLAGEIKGLNKLWNIPCMWNGQKIWVDILPKKIWVVNKHEKISTLSVMRETNWSHSEMPPYTHEDRCDEKDVQRWVLAAKWKSWNLHNLAVENAKWYSCFGRHLGIFLKTKHKLIIRPSNSTPRYILKRNDSTYNFLCPHKNFYTNIHSSIIHIIPPPHIKQSKFPTTGNQINKMW